MVAVLEALERQRDPAVEPFVRAAAESWTIWKVARPVRRQARRSLQTILAEVDRQRACKTLLRGAEVPAQLMVRPAQPRRKESGLLRPDSGTVVGRDLL
jgi:hypothetical protein